MTPPTTATGLDISLDGVDARFATAGGQIEALAGLDLAVDAGSFTAVIGPNGCGKSTLLRVIAGLKASDAGRVLVGGAEPLAGDGRVGLDFQQPRLVPWRSVIDNVALPMELAGVAPDVRRDRAEAALAQVGLATAARLRPRELSGGMAQRAALARALGRRSPGACCSTSRSARSTRSPARSSTPSSSASGSSGRGPWSSSPIASPRPSPSPIRSWS